MAAETKLNFIKLIANTDDTIIEELKDDITDLSVLIDSLKSSVNKQLDAVTDSSESSETSDESPSEEETPGSWEELKVNSNYEINDAYPYRIRKKNQPRLIKECKRNGYKSVNIGNKLFF
jgi:hypothetical protein